jgi:ABC-type dipeptide/oligopeptide/nickel transport system permease subunit
MSGQQLKTESARTVLTITTALLIVYLFTGWQWAVLAGVLLGIAGVFSRTVSRLIHSCWMQVAYLLSLIIPKVLLTLIFYLVLLPVALLSRVFRKESSLKLENHPGSMFRDLNKTFKKEDFKKPW